jgi:hypothetical protein
MIPTKENRRARRNSCPRATLSNKNPACNGLGLKPGLRCQAKETNSRDMARLTYSSPKTQLQRRDGAVDIP